MDVRRRAIGCALLAALFYALNAPLSKLMMSDVPPRMMAVLLYLGAGVGVGAMYALHWRHEEPGQRLTRRDLPYTVGMILLDICAPIFLMLGLRYGSASGASLLGNFEIVATALIALVVFGEKVSRRLWLAIVVIMLSGMLLSLEGQEGPGFSRGSLLVLLATACWGLENNCTRSISDKSTYQIVTLKGIFSGGGALCVALMSGERLPHMAAVLPAMALGFVAYGLSIFMYIRAQRDLGAAKTSAYYAVAPFVGALLSFVLMGEPLTGTYLAAAALMLAGTALAVSDTLTSRHAHRHSHTVMHLHDGKLHAHTIVHEHEHAHCAATAHHGHHHARAELRRELAALHHGA